MQALAKEEGVISFLTPIGYQAEDCGYCKDRTTNRRTPNSRACYYAVSKDLTVDDYQGLVDRGWRRSGAVLYKPDVRRHCCPHYTIRIPVDSFKPARDQRHAVHRWNKFVLGDAYIENAARAYPKTRAEKAQQKNSFVLTEAIHESEYSNIKRPPEPAHRFEVSLEPDNFTEEKYTIFENYQRAVHHERPSDISQRGFRRFLCDSPLHRATRASNGTEQPLGSFHQCYRLDGRLIAVGVIDLLPHCVSGVYFMYHEDFERWSFGKLSALREAALALEAGYGYYYMGYYIHSCMKMRYKADYKPQYVLDPESLEWDPLDGDLRRLLDSKAYVSLSREQGSSGDKAVSDGESSEYRHKGMKSDSLPFPLPADAGVAVEHGTSLFELEIPGVLTVEEVVEKVDIGQISMELQGGLVVQMEDLVVWENGNPLDPRSLKGFIAEFAACVGPKVAKSMVVRLRPSSPYLLAFVA